MQIQISPRLSLSLGSHRGVPLEPMSPSQPHSSTRRQRWMLHGQPGGHSPLFCYVHVRLATNRGVRLGCLLDRMFTDICSWMEGCLKLHGRRSVIPAARPTIPALCAIIQENAMHERMHRSKDQQIWSEPLTACWLRKRPELCITIGHVLVSLLRAASSRPFLINSVLASFAGARASRMLVFLLIRLSESEPSSS